jgi:hypothetical protein
MKRTNKRCKKKKSTSESKSRSTSVKPLIPLVEGIFGFVYKHSYRGLLLAYLFLRGFGWASTLAKKWLLETISHLPVDSAAKGLFNLAEEWMRQGRVTPKDLADAIHLGFPPTQRTEDILRILANAAGQGVAQGIAHGYIGLLPALLLANPTLLLQNN